MSDLWIYINILFLKKEVIKNFNEESNANKPYTMEVSLVVCWPPPQIIIIVRMLIAKYIIFEYYTLKLLVMRNVQKQLEIEVCTCKIEKTKIDYFRVTSQRPWLLHFIWQFIKL